MDKTAHISQTNNIVIKTSAATTNMPDNGMASPRQEGVNQNDNQSIPEPHTQPCKTLVIGDSLLRDMNEPVGVCISYEAGATLSSALDLINKANDNHTGLMNPDNVVIHLATNDVMYQSTSAAMTIVNYGVTLENVSASFPEAVIGLCSIPPRKGTSIDIKRSKETARMVNEYLESMALSKPEKYVWIDTWSKFWSTKGHTIKQFYQSSDQKRVHLNAPCKYIIINTIVNSLLHESAGGCKRKYSSNHSPTAGQLAKEQILSSSPPANSN